MCSQILFLLLTQLRADGAGATFDLGDEVGSTGDAAVFAGEDGATVTAYLAFVARAAFILGEQFLAVVGVALGEMELLGSSWWQRTTSGI